MIQASSSPGSGHSTSQLPSSSCRKKHSRHLPQDSSCSLASGPAQLRHQQQQQQQQDQEHPQASGGPQRQFNTRTASPSASPASQRGQASQPAAALMLQMLLWTQQMLQEQIPGPMLTLTVISSSRSLQPLALNEPEPGSNAAAAAPKAPHRSSSRCTRLLQQQHRAVTEVVMATVTAAVPLAALLAVRRTVLLLMTQQIQTSSPRRMR